MGQVQALQAVAALLYMCTLGVVGVRLLRLWQRTRQAPELLLGLSLVLGGVIGSVLEAGGMGVAEGADPQVAGRMLLAGKSVGLAALCCQMLFVWRVFRPAERWPAGMVALVLAMPASALAGFAAHGTFQTAQLAKPWVAVEFAGRLAASIWMLLEAARYHGLLRKRVRLGLADPVVTNRFLLWSMAAVTSMVLLGTSIPPIFLDRIAYQTLLQFDMVVFSAAGMITAGLYWLTFFPPARYRRWLETRHPAA